jgi:alginate O-acetyltransferase complex protein AlgI
VTFNSWVFVCFFAIVYAGYLALLRSFRLQNAWLLAASLIFYAWWDPRFLFLLLATAGVDFVMAQLIGSTDDAARRRLYLAISVASNLSVLGFFKYFNFLAGNVVALVGLVVPVRPVALDVILPVGISFYTFQSISYVSDVYRREVEPARNPIAFFLFVCFFPHMVAGPIMHSSALLPQMLGPRRVGMEQVQAGLFLILWGYFKKMVVADNCALIANPIFENYARYQGLDLLVGMLAFTVQIYGDFSGYSDIARGLAKLMGFELMVNFRIPYLATSPSDFWRRWHISLSTWLRDYLYIPLGGNRSSGLGTYRNLAFTMLLGGLWHGAAWNYVLWGGYHGALLILYRALGRDGREWGEGRVPEPLRAAGMFVLTVIGWVLFRSRSVGQIVYMLRYAGLAASPATGDLAYSLLFFAAPLVLVEAYEARRGDLLAPSRLPLPFRVALYAALSVGVGIFGVRQSVEFIYFQF